jgi:hypothetical protein
MRLMRKACEGCSIRPRAIRLRRSEERPRKIDSFPQMAVRVHRNTMPIDRANLPSDRRRSSFTSFSETHGRLFVCFANSGFGGGPSLRHRVGGVVLLSNDRNSPRSGKSSGRCLPRYGEARPQHEARPQSLCTSVFLTAVRSSSETRQSRPDAARDTCSTSFRLLASLVSASDFSGGLELKPDLCFVPLTTGWSSQWADAGAGPPGAAPATSM